jgi:aspartyl-tRNA(Asn)/glutamyl-tRNA(Gln) amidotransferase subunit C
MRVEKQEIEKLAKLARLEFSPEDLEKLQGSLGSLVEYLDTLKQINLDGVEPMTAVDDAPRPLRPDVLGAMLPKDKALMNAPEVNLEHFSIPKVIGG